MRATKDSTGVWVLALSIPLKHQWSLLNQEVAGFGTGAEVALTITPSLGISSLDLGPPQLAASSLCAEHDRQLGGVSPLSSLMVAKD